MPGSDRTMFLSVKMIIESYILSDSVRKTCQTTRWSPANHRSLFFLTCVMSLGGRSLGPTSSHFNCWRALCSYWSTSRDTPWEFWPISVPDGLHLSVGLLSGWYHVVRTRHYVSESSPLIFQSFSQLSQFGATFILRMFVNSAPVYAVVKNNNVYVKP